MKRFNKFMGIALATVMLVITSLTPVLANEKRTFTTAEIDQWIVGTSAILNYNNHEISNLFTADLTPAVRQRVESTSRQILTGNSWNIQNRQDLLDQVEIMTEFGHNSNFWDDVYFLIPIMTSPNGIEDLMRSVEVGLVDIDTAIHLVETWDIAMHWGEAGIMAWDLFRVGNLLVWGYHAGFITRDEARELMVPAAELLYENFDSWEEAAANYLDGLLYWRGAADDEFFNRVDVVEGMFERNDPVFNNSLFE